jgi:peptidyl-prolyl cis-trans isomerase SurA
MRARWLFTLVLLSVTAAASAEPPPRAGVIDRIVAVVNNKLVLLSELRARCKPYAKQIQASYPSPAEIGKRVMAEEQMRKQLVDKLIDELLVAQEADKAGIAVTAAEVDGAMQNVASGQHITVAQLVAAALDAGMPEKEYREELRRQLLEGKMLQLRLSREPVVSSQAEYAKVLERLRQEWMLQLRQANHVEVRL